MIGVITSQDGFLSGRITFEGTLQGTIRNEGIIKGSLIASTGYTDYLGEYIITPKIEEQTMYTHDTHMVQDVTIKGIPYYEIENPKGGTTFIIS